MLRSIQKSVDYIKAEDPNTAIKVNTVRTWCKEGKVKYFTVGNKILVDLDNLLEYIGHNKK